MRDMADAATTVMDDGDGESRGRERHVEVEGERLKTVAAPGQ